MTCTEAEGQAAGLGLDQANDVAGISGGETPQALPPSWRLRVFHDPDQLADAVTRRLLQRQLSQPLRPLGLATGRTMVPIYACLAREVQRLPMSQRQQLRRDWLSFNLDEYVGLGVGDCHSFRTTMNESLVLPLGLDPARVRVPEGQAADPQREAERYAASLSEAGGLGLQLLGLGLNGHVGFNEPPCEAEAPCRCVRLSPSTRAANAAAFGGVPTAVPEQAITLGLRDILAAEEILLLVTGASKADILQALLRNPTSSQLPASWLKRHPAVTLMVDAAAMARD